MFWKRKGKSPNAKPAAPDPHPEDTPAAKVEPPASAEVGPTVEPVESSEAAGPPSIVELSEEIVTRKGGIASLLSFVRDDDVIPELLRRHDTNIEVLPSFYRNLKRHGAGQWVGDRYAAVAALTDPAAVDFMLDVLDQEDMLLEYDKWLYISGAVVDHVAGRRPLEHAGD